MLFFCCVRSGGSSRPTRSQEHPLAIGSSVPPTGERAATMNHIASLVIDDWQLPAQKGNYSETDVSIHRTLLRFVLSQACPTFRVFCAVHGAGPRQHPGLTPTTRESKGTMMYMIEIGYAQEAGQEAGGLIL